ncbi:MAG: hypothetical protein HYT76_01500 [Deltaproteobacteria bacterium]|nr:hypothetical protein [Deltaproteobacteria bacterium]
MSKVDLKPLIEGQWTHNRVDTLLTKIAAEDNNAEALDENDFPLGIVDGNTEEVAKFLDLADTYLKTRLSAKGNEKGAVDFFVAEFSKLKALSSKYKVEELPTRQENPLRPSVTVRGSFTGLALLGIGDANGTADLVETDPMTGLPKQGSVDWDIQRYGIAVEKLSPMTSFPGADQFPWVRYGWQAGFTFYDGQMDYEGEKVANLDGQSISSGLVGGVEYPFTSWATGRFFANFNVEVGRFDTTLTDTDPDVDGSQNPIKDPCSGLGLGPSAGCEVERTLAVYVSLPIEFVAGARLFNFLDIDFAWQRPVKMESSGYVFIPDEMNTFWVRLGITDSH